LRGFVADRIAASTPNLQPFRAYSLSGDTLGAMPAFWDERPVLVTGAAGFIGSHLVEALARAGAQLRAFVRYNSRNNYGWLEEIAPELLERLEIFRGDLCNPEALTNALDGIDTVFHLGAVIPIPYSYLHAREYVETNIVGTLNVLEAARRSPTLRRIVHTSTSEVYGTPEQIPIPETHRLHPQSPYAASKVGADQMAASYFASFDLAVVTARPFNTYGPRQSARAIIPTIISQALLREDEIELGSLETTRDFLFVADTVSGMLSLGETPGIEGELVNLGTGVETPIGDLVEMIRRMLDSELPVVAAPARLRPTGSEVERLCADASKAEALLGWKSEVSIEQGLARTAEWLRDSVDDYKATIYNL
jgi:NAD dependent epimerase/dehydratase